MMAAPSRDWSVFKQIFAEHWDAFQHAHPRYQTTYYDCLVTKMLGCGNLEKMGNIEYRCLHCGQGKHLVAMRSAPSCPPGRSAAYGGPWLPRPGYIAKTSRFFGRIFPVLLVFLG
jgi:hypothetical protein